VSSNFPITYNPGHNLPPNLH